MFTEFVPEIAKRLLHSFRVRNDKLLTSVKTSCHRERSTNCHRERSVAI